MTDLEPILRRDLNTIAHYWPDLTELPHTPGGDKVDTTLASPTPLAIGVLSLQFDCAQQVAAWAHLVWDEQRLRTRLNLMDTVLVCGFLSTHANFLAHHPAGRDAVEEIGWFAGQIVELVRQTKARRTVIGGCPDCNGQLVAFMRPSDALLPSEVRCSANRDHKWTPWEWTFLGRRIRAKART